MLSFDPLFLAGGFSIGPWHEEQYNKNNGHYSHPEFLGKHGCGDEKNEEGFLKKASLSEYHPHAHLEIHLLASRKDNQESGSFLRFPTDSAPLSCSRRHLLPPVGSIR
jgi:hypothetical protein